MSTKITYLNVLKFLVDNNYNEDAKNLSLLIKTKDKIKNTGLDSSTSVDQFIEIQKQKEIFYNNLYLLKQTYYNETQILNYSHTFGWILYNND